MDSLISATVAYTDQAIEVLNRPEVVVVSLIGYLCSKPVVASFRDAINLKSDSQNLKAFVFIHNLLLFLFSGLVVLKTWPLTYNFYKTNGWVELHCNNTGFFDNTDFGWWAQVFYISKYWEFIDSWILVLKGKTPSLLQVYHHTGIAICMYAAMVFHANWVLWVVTLNSFIHTLMYAYFSAATLGYKSPYAKYLTRMQLGQFFLGITVSSCIYFIPGCSGGWHEGKGAMCVTHLYAVGLIILFKQMYDNKYTPAQKEAFKQAGAKKTK